MLSYTFLSSKTKMILNWWEGVWLFLLSHQTTCFGIWCRHTDCMYIQPKLPCLFPHVAERIHRRRGSSSVESVSSPTCQRAAWEQPSPLRAQSSLYLPWLCLHQWVPGLPAGWLPLLLPVTAGSSGGCALPEETTKNKDLPGNINIASSWGNYCSVNLQISLGWFWSPPPVQCYTPPSIALQALCLTDLISWIYLSPLLYNHQGFDLGHTSMA